MMKRSCRLIAAAAVLLLVVAVPAAHAQLSRVGPVLPTTDGYPAWYQDKTGLTLEFCRPNQAELNASWCVILPADVPNGVAPETAFTNYAGEHFYFAAVSGSRPASGAILVLAVEAAFAIDEPVAGDQIVFGRLRIVVPSLPASGDYKVYTPYGDFTFKGQSAGDRLFFTSDIGVQCSVGNFDCALNSAIGPFLLPSAVPGGAEVPPMPDLAANPTADPYYLALEIGRAHV